MSRRHSIQSQMIAGKGGARMRVVVERREIAQKKSPTPSRETVQEDCGKWRSLGSIAAEIAGSIRITGRLPRACRVVNGED